MSSGETSGGRLHSDGEGGPQPRDDGLAEVDFDHLLREVLTRVHGGQDLTQVDDSVVVALAAAAGVAIENATLYEEAEQRQAWLSATVEITSLLSEDTPTDRALQAVADRARSVSGADVAWVVSGSDPQDLHLEVVAGAPVDREAMHALPMEQSLASLVVRTGLPVSVDDLATDPRAVDPSFLDGWPQL